MVLWIILIPYYYFFIYLLFSRKKVLDESCPSSICRAKVLSHSVYNDFKVEQPQIKEDAQSPTILVQNLKLRIFVFYSQDHQHLPQRGYKWISITGWFFYLKKINKQIWIFHACNFLLTLFVCHNPTYKLKTVAVWPTHLQLYFISKTRLFLSHRELQFLADQERISPAAIKKTTLDKVLQQPGVAVSGVANGNGRSGLSLFNTRTPRIK